MPASDTPNPVAGRGQKKYMQFFHQNLRVLLATVSAEGSLSLRSMFQEAFPDALIQTYIFGSAAPGLPEHFDAQIILLEVPEATDMDVLVKMLKQIKKHIPVILFSQNEHDDITPATIQECAEWITLDYLSIETSTTASLKKIVRSNMEKIRLAGELQETTERYDLLTKATNNIVWDWELERRSAYWVGNGLKVILGYDVQEIVVNTDFWEENLHPEDRERVVNNLMQIFAAATSTNWEDEYRFRGKDGNYKIIYDRGFIIYNNGKAVRMIGSMEDITAKKMAQEASIASQKNYKSLFDNNPLATFIWDINNFEILEVNETAVEEYGYSREEFLQLSVLDLRPTADVPNFKVRLNLLKDAHNTKQEFTWTHINKSGEPMLMQVSSYGITYEGRPAVIALSKNITEKVALEKKLEAEKSLKQKQLAEAIVTAQEKERTEIGKELHDNVNQLLSASRLYIEAAKNDQDNGTGLLTQASGYIMNAIEEIRFLSKALNTPLINELGLCEAIENLAEELMVVNTTKIIVETNDFQEKELDENFKLTLFRIIQEQISNIMKHAHASEARILLQRTAEQIILIITDNGIGFDTQARRKGIGLSNINSRAGLYKGQLIISSEEGKGTSLHIEFPMTDILEQPAM
ncbi:MAG: hypothetical protein JWQ27_2583 [Ferruginibacter sp.]|nr:hypothetical protein [Ferruginibacter sp.]